MTIGGIGTGINTASQLQGLRARQAFVRARTPGHNDEAAGDDEGFQQGPALEPPAHQPASRPRVQLPYDDIRNVAARAGYVGVSDRDIQRAYMTGQSLLVNVEA